MKEENKKRQVAKISVFITSIFVIFLSVTYAFINQTLVGTKRQVITSGNLSLELLEDENNLEIVNALPMYDEVGMLQEAFTFRVINQTNQTTNYILKLEKMNVTGELAKEDVKYGLTRSGEVTIDFVSNIIDNTIDEGTIEGNETIEYSLRLWIKDSITDIERIENKSIKYRINISADQTREYAVIFDTMGGEMGDVKKVVSNHSPYGELPVPTRTGFTFVGWYTEKEGGEKIEATTVANTKTEPVLYARWEHILLSSMKQGDYVAYVGNNGCQNNGVNTTGTKDAESKNSCLGWNANQTDEDTTTFGYCYAFNKSRITTTGWRIAYIENGRVHLISAGMPECRASSGVTQNLINLLNQNARKYCNTDYVDGDCSDNSDTWAIRDTDFFKMTKTINGGTGYHLISRYGNPYCHLKSSSACGNANNLIKTGSDYWFAEVYNPPSYPYSSVYWESDYNRVTELSNTERSLGLRPIIKLSASVYITGGSGTMKDPYQIANNEQ